MLLQLIAYGGFISSSIFFFKKSNTKNFNILIIKVVGSSLMLFNLYQTYIIDSFEVIAWLGSLCLLISCITFYWAIYENRKTPLNFAFTDLEKVRLVKTGPYRLVRHPFYSSYIIAWIGAFLLSFSIISFLLSTILILMYFKSSYAEEQGFLDGPLREEYRKYIRTTNRFFPTKFM